MSRGFGTTFGAATTDLITTRATTALQSQHTVAAWVYIHGTGGGAQGRIFSTPAFATAGWIMNAGGSLMQIAEDFTVTDGVFTYPNPTFDKWHHLCFTYDGSSTANLPVVYVDGATVTVSALTTPSGVFATGGGAITLGNRTSDSARNFDGMLAHFAVWNRVLVDSGAIRALASGVNPLLINPEYLLTYCPLDGVNTPEFDCILGNSSTITGTRLGTQEPPVQPFSRIRRLFDYDANAAAGASFQAAWALNSNKLMQIGEPLQ